ncbi:MAG: hypothetical protein ACJAWV_002745 [Flammeovirgaceae bacterium]|jgi:hypothetical protein
MKTLNKIIFIVLVCSLVCFFSCTSEDTPRTKFEFFRNSSAVTVQVLTFNSGKIEVNDSILSGEDRFLCSYTLGIDKPKRAYCHDSVVFVFPNKRGYVCGSIDRLKCFSNGRSPLTGNAPGFPNTSGRDFVFTITEEDYLNAKELD